MTGEDISKWMASKLFTLSHRRTARGVAPAKASSRTRAKRLALLQLVFKWAFKRHLVARLPFDDSHVVHVLKLGSQGKGKLVGDARVGAVVTLEEVEQVVDWLEERRTDDETDPVFQDPVPSMAIRVAAYAGLRLRELVHARVEDVATDGRFIQVVSGRPCACAHCKGDGAVFRTKNASSRDVPVSPELAPVLAEYLVERRAVPTDADGIRWLFPVWRSRLRTRAEAGAQRRSESIAKTWKRAAKETLKRTDVILHDLRRTAYTNLYERSGGKVALVKMAVGHRLDVLEQTYNKMGRELLYAQLFPKPKSEQPATSAATIKSKFTKSRAVA